MPKKTLTIGMAVYDDYDGVYFTIQSLRINHQICNSNHVEFVVLDNNPSSKRGQATEKFLKGSVNNSKYIPKEGNCTSFNKYEIVEHSDGKYILILDCHVLLESNAIDYLLDYYMENKNCKNLVQGPLMYDSLKYFSTHFDQQWRGGMYGTWATNHEKLKENKPFEIPMQGMGLCSFEKNNWPGIGKHFQGFGAEEGYIAEKFRQNGGKNICLPQLKWCHRFGRPDGVPYKLTLEDRVWNYFIGWLELTNDQNHDMIKGIYEHFKERIPQKSLDGLLQRAIITIQGDNNAASK
jgi:hypothetical protein